MSHSSDSEPEEEDSDYFGLLSDGSEADPSPDIAADIDIQPELAGDLGFAQPIELESEVAPAPEIPPGVESPPISQLGSGPVAPQEAEKKPFVAKRKVVPTSPEPQPSPAAPAKKAAPAQKEVTPKGKAKKQPAKKKIPKKKTAAAVPKAPPKKAAPATAPSKKPGRAAKLEVDTAIKALLVLACVGIAAIGILLWQHTKSPSHEASSPQGVAELEAKTAELSAKIAELEMIRTLQRYASEAIADGHRSALHQLHDYFDDPGIQSLKAVADAEIIRVETYYVTTRYVRGFPSEMPFVSESDPVGSLARILLSDDYTWAVRARAAMLLADHKNSKPAAEALVEASQTDANLYVVQEAILAFSKLTGFRSTGVFDSKSVARWWEKNQGKFERPDPEIEADPSASL